MVLALLSIAVIGRLFSRSSSLRKMSNLAFQYLPHGHRAGSSISHFVYVEVSRVVQDAAAYQPLLGISRRCFELSFVERIEEFATEYFLNRAEAGVR